MKGPCIEYAIAVSKIVSSFSFSWKRRPYGTVARPHKIPKLPEPPKKKTIKKAKPPAKATSPVRELRKSVFCLLGLCWC